MAKHKCYTAEFKAKVALEAIREELTTAELSKNYEVQEPLRRQSRGTTVANHARYWADCRDGGPIGRFLRKTTLRRHED